MDEVVEGFALAITRQSRLRSHLSGARPGIVVGKLREAVGPGGADGEKIAGYASGICRSWARKSPDSQTGPRRPRAVRSSRLPLRVAAEFVMRVVEGGTNQVFMRVHHHELFVSTFLPI